MQLTKTHTQNSCHHLKMFSDLVFFRAISVFTLLLHSFFTDKILVIYEYFRIHVAFYFIIKSCHRYKNTHFCSIFCNSGRNLRYLSSILFFFVILLIFKSNLLTIKYLFVSKIIFM